MAKSLGCGGRGPCCHIGYSHRHCEHCDVVIDTRSYHPYPYTNSFPYGQWWNTGTAVTPNSQLTATTSSFGLMNGAFGGDPVSGVVPDGHTCEGRVVVARLSKAAVIKKDRRVDAKAGIKEGSKADLKADKKAGVPKGK